MSGVRFPSSPPSFATSLRGAKDATPYGAKRQKAGKNNHTDPARWLRLGGPPTEENESPGNLIMSESDYHYVYVLVSEKHPERHYTGYTTNLQDRLRRHNNGDVPHTDKYKPWRIETAVRFSSEEKAHAFERYLKSGSGREFARRHF